MKKKSSSIIIIVIGVLIVGFFTWSYIGSGNKKKSFDSETTATNIEKNCEIEEDHSDDTTSKVCRPIYTYVVDDVEYKCETNVGSSIVNTKKNKVFYDSKNPEKCMSEFEVSTNKFTLVGVAIGLLAIAVGIKPMIKKENN